MKINAELLLKFVVQHIINAGGQESPSHLLHIIWEKFRVSHTHASNAYSALIVHGYIVFNTDGRVELTKKACDQIRAYNAREESKQCQA